MLRFALAVAALALLGAACAASTPAGERPAEEPPTATLEPAPAQAEAEVTVEAPGFEPPFGTASWDTDFSRHTVPYAEILSGGPPKDGIPAVDNPKYMSAEEADAVLDDAEPVVSVTLNGETRAFPVRVLIWHEIVNSEVGGAPVSVTYCPLCNSAIAFDRRFEGQVLDFGTTGRLRYSDLVMYDRQTESWWQQISGEAIVGELAGKKLTFIPASLVSWADFHQAHSNAQVLSEDTGHSRPYGRNPYGGYDTAASPFLYRGPEIPDALPAMERIVTLDLAGEKVAYPYQVLQEEPAVNDVVGGEPVVVLWKPGQASALDSSSIAGGRDVGSGVVFSREVGGRELTFEPAEDGLFRDQETGSQWNILGQAVGGPLEGEELEAVLHVNTFWFAWAALAAEGRIYGQS